MKGAASRLARAWAALWARPDGDRGRDSLPVFAPPGHYYSPIPSTEDVERAASRPIAAAAGGIDLREPEQLALLTQLASFYPSMPFAPHATEGLRYRLENESYSYADGVLFHCLLRHLKPRRVIEVGSGFTSALLLDTNERFLASQIACTFIEPYPELLLSLLSAQDRLRAQLLTTRLQDVDPALFDTLGSGDVLFIDSTHVSKANSDVNQLFFEILPRLAPGVWVHLHDIFPSFEYPLEWLRQGRAWNEQYLLRAFLQYNHSFEVRLFGSYLIGRHADWFGRHMPLCLLNPGGAFWMQRTA